MSKVISKSYRGYCPEIKSERDIKVWHKIDITFPHSQFGRFMNVSCPDENNCCYVKEHGDCPLLSEVKEHYNPNARDNI